MRNLDLLPFQRRFVARALAPGIRTAALSLPRGNAKSTLAAWLMARCLTPGDPLHVPGAEFHLCAASIGQVRRTTWRLLREFMGDDGAYKWSESRSEVAVHHRPTGTRCTVLASSGKTAQGLVRCPLIAADEPGAWETVGGQTMWDAIAEAQGKPGADLRVILIGTLAPARSGWWHDLIADGSHGDTYVMALQADRAKWDRASEIRRVNPLMWRFPESRKLLLERRDKARGDSAARARFFSFRLNLPSADEAVALLTVDDWERTCARPVGDADGRPVVGIDLGGGRSWSAAVAVWRSGRTEAIAVAPGIPTIGDQERRDRVPAGTYAKLLEGGALAVDQGRRVPSPAVLMDRVRTMWGPRYVLCDRFRLGELMDACPSGIRLVPRVPRWRESTEDIRALRRMAKDGPLSVEPGSRALIQASLAVATVKNDDAGNHRLVKDTNDTARDDVAAAWLFAAGAVARTKPRSGSKVAVPAA